MIVGKARATGDAETAIFQVPDWGATLLRTAGRRR